MAFLALLPIILLILFAFGMFGSMWFGEDYIAWFKKDIKGEDWDAIIHALEFEGWREGSGFADNFISLDDLGVKIQCPKNLDDVRIEIENERFTLTIGQRFQVRNIMRKHITEKSLAKKKEALKALRTSTTGDTNV